MSATRKSGEFKPHDCDQSAILADHEERIRDAEKALAEGDTRFVKLEGQLSNVAEKLAELSDTIKGAIRWVLVTVGGIAVTGVLYAVIQHGKAAVP